MSKSKRLKIIIITSIITIPIAVGALIYAIREPAEECRECYFLRYQNLTASMARIELERDSSIVLLDVRTIEENEEIRIPNSLLIPINELSQRVETEIPDKRTRIFVYCRSGNRSFDASMTLINLGYKSVYNIGGIIDWNYETE
ncbi:MAG: rhodanese-like domain-containing protein [Oscillospiraceae bacterium]|nr:rhodanese-like domain-containing protein [Oscillospiraceae bacterium]